MLAIGAAAAVGVVAALRSGGGTRRHSGVIVHCQGSRGEQVERPHRHVAHYHASGALPRWDP